MHRRRFSKEATCCLRMNRWCVRLLRRRRGTRRLRLSRQRSRLDPRSDDTLCCLELGVGLGVVQRLLLGLLLHS